MRGKSTKKQSELRIFCNLAKFYFDVLALIYNSFNAIFKYRSLKI
jgi:hypothetical protein